MRSHLLFALALTTLGAAGCSGGAESDDSSDAIEASGSVKALFSDAKKLDLGDLGGLVANYAGDSFNRAFDGNLGMRTETRVYAKQADPSRVFPDGATLGGLDQIASNLENRLGGTELGTRLTKARIAAIEAGKAKYFVESAFSFNAGVAHDWSFKSAGIVDGNSTVGLDVGTELESRVVSASDDGRLEAMIGTSLAAAKGARGFFAPRSLEDIRSMVPGESFALRGRGRFATNLGLGVPVYTGAAGPLGYQVVMSAGVGAIAQGRLDVQLMRLEGDEVVVDIGIDQLKGFQVRAEIGDRFGIKGICDDGSPCLRDVDLGGKTTKLQSLVEKAVTGELQRRFQSRANVTVDKDAQRIGLTRIHFHLDRGKPGEVARALEQALKFDARYAESLSHRDLDVATPGVEVEFDAMRAATTNTVDFGFKLAGIDVYQRAAVERTGTFVYQTPDGATLLSFDVLDRNRKSFQTDHGIRRIAASARIVDARKPSAWRTEANLIVRTRYSDTHIHDNRFVSGLDGVIGALGGHPVLAAIDPAGAELERTLASSCPPPAPSENGGAARYDESCNVRLLADPSFVAVKQRGLDALTQATASMPADLQKLLLAAGTERLGLQSVQTSGSAMSTDGVALAVTVDQRFDDEALAILMQRSGDDYKKALQGYLASLTIERAKLGQGTTRDAEEARVGAKYATAIGAMTQVFTSSAAAYQKTTAGEKALTDALGSRPYIAAPLGIRYASVDAAGEAQSPAITAASRERANAIASMIDGLRASADKGDLDLKLYEEQTAVVPLVALVPAKNLKVGLVVSNTGFDDDKLSSRERFRKAGLVDVDQTATGERVAPISLGVFDLEAALTSSGK